MRVIVRRPELAALAVAVLGTLLAMQGWKSRILNFDLLTTIVAGRALLEHGQVPDQGVLTSFNSFAPPGAVWIMAAGMLVFNDPRLFEFVGALALYFGTLAGIFLLGRTCLGMPGAILAVALYGLSELGLSGAASLWQRFPMHCVYVWVVYWTVRWGERHNAWFLAAAISTWGIGMYVFMEIAPAMFILPAVWLLYRPPVRLVPLLVAGVLIAAVWSPYLIFERQRDFKDLKSQVLRERVIPSDLKQAWWTAWCSRDLAADNWPKVRDWVEPPPSDPGRSSIRGLVLTVGARAYLLTQSLLSNFKANASIPGTEILFLPMTLVALFALSLRSGTTRVLKTIEHDPARWVRRLKRCGMAAVLAGLLLNEKLLAGYGARDGTLSVSTITTIRWLQVVLVLAGAVMVLSNGRVLRSLARLVERLCHPRKAPVILAIALIVPWALMLLITEGARLSRFWWLWPLQAMALASAVTYLPVRLRAARWVPWAGATLLVLLVLGKPVLMRASAWAKDGWAGRDSPQVQLVDQVARMIRSQNGNEASIGYEIYFFDYLTAFNTAVLDARYRVGTDWDLFFRYRHGIVNRNQCAEGVSAADDYRIVQTLPAHPLEQDRLSVPRTDEFRLTVDLGAYRVLERRSPQTALRE